jgi:hypothetical protein
MHLPRHRFSNFGKPVLNKVGFSFPDWNERLRWHVQEFGLLNFIFSMGEAFAQGNSKPRPPVRTFAARGNNFGYETCKGTSWTGKRRKKTIC